jgi:hypothetical protein
MGKQFLIKKLAESYEIQKSYDRQDYFEAVMKCRIYLESWLVEFINAVLFPYGMSSNEDGRQYIQEHYQDMFIQIDWLKRQGHLNNADFHNLNKIRAFCDNVIRKGDVFKVVNREELDRYIEITVNYCQKIKELTQQLIEKTAIQ